VFTPEKMAEEIERRLQRIASGPALAARWNKKICRRLTPDAEPLSRDELREFFSAWHDSPDHKEGVAAFLEKRRPKFQ
jgi:enoyl-CoA hydratase/carnithine racemase